MSAQTAIEQPSLPRPQRSAAPGHPITTDAAAERTIVRIEAEGKHCLRRRFVVCRRTAPNLQCFRYELVRVKVAGSKVGLQILVFFQ
jgi:hypothetical protein